MVAWLAKSFGGPFTAQCYALLTFSEHNTPVTIVQATAVLQKPRVTKNARPVAPNVTRYGFAWTLTHTLHVSYRTGLTRWHFDLGTCRLVHRQPMLFCKLLIENIQACSWISKAFCRYTTKFAFELHDKFASG